jgi:hypothetical protein
MFVTRVRRPLLAGSVLAGLVGVPFAGSAQTPAPPAPRAPRYWGTLTPGRHPIGYRLTYLHDSSRTAVGPSPDSARVSMPRIAAEPPRIVPVRVWYPAAQADAPRSARGRRPIPVSRPE